MFTALAMFLSLGAGAISLIGQGLQAKENKKVAREDVERAKEDLVTQRETDKGSILAGSVATGVSGDSFNAFIGRNDQQYNKQIKLNQEGLDKFIQNTNTNLALNTVSTVLGVGSSVVQSGYDAGWFNKKVESPMKQGLANNLQQWGYSAYNSSKPWKSIY